MNEHILSGIFPKLNSQHLDAMTALLTELEANHNLFVGFVHGIGEHHRFLYVNDAIEKMSGYPTVRFLNDNGMRFYYSITPDFYLPYILEREAFYTKEAKQLNFDIKQPQIIEINAGIRHVDGSLIKIRMLGLTLEYTFENDLLLILTTGHNINDCDTKYLDQVKSEIERIFGQFKKLYVASFPEKFSRSSTITNDPVKVTYPLYCDPGVTKTEIKVLQLIADGLSSKQIADRLHISFHTAESHRRNLLVKFCAKNAAELMKKATKVYWFE